MNAAPPGWNPDPTGRHEYRYWDGASWTDDVSDGGVTAIDALGGAAPGGDEPTAPFDATAAEPTPPSEPTAPFEPTPPSEPTAPFEPTPPSEPTAPFEPTAPYDTGPPGGFGAGPGQAPGGYGAAPGQGYGGYGGPPGVPGAPDAYGGAPPPPSAPGRSGPPVGLLVGLGVLALIVVVVLAVVLSRDDGDDTATDDVTTTTTATDDTEPETTTTAAPETTVAGPQDADVFSLAVGDCLVEETPDGEVQSLPVVPCEQPHASEIYYLHIIEGDSLPGPDEMESIARDECLPQFETFVGVPYEESVLLVTWLEPTQASWDSGDRELLCIAVDPEGDATGSFAGTAR